MEPQAYNSESAAADFDWLTIREVAAELRSSVSHVKTLLGQRGGPVEIGHFKHGRRTLIKRKELERYKARVEYAPDDAFSRNGPLACCGHSGKFLAHGLWPAMRKAGILYRSRVRMFAVKCNGSPSPGDGQPMETNKETTLLVTVREAMHLLHRGRARVYEMCATGELESIRDGRSILIPRDALDQWIAQKRRKGGLTGRPAVRKSQASIL